MFEKPKDKIVFSIFRKQARKFFKNNWDEGGALEEIPIT